MSKFALALAMFGAALTVSACEVDRLGGTTFARGELAKTFVFEARSNNIFPHNTDEGERYRMSQLRKWLTDNKMCSGGFLITARSSVYAAGAVHFITYRGRCTAD